MLINFKMRNFMSFNEETDLSMEVGERLRKFNSSHTIENQGTRLLKSVIMFGPNGAGKSNLIMGLDTMKKMILKNPATINDKLSHYPFLLREEKNRETHFEVEFIFENIFYEFSFSYNEDKYFSEKLIFKENNKRKKIYYSRNEEGFEILPPKYHSLAKNIRKNSLMVFNLQDINDKHAVNIMNWFYEKLSIDTAPTEKLIDILKIPSKKRLFLDILKLADFNIKDIEFSQIDAPINAFEKDFLTVLNNRLGIGQDKIPTTTTKTTINTIYHQYDFKNKTTVKRTLPINYESSGTQKFIDIILTILQGDNDGRVLVFDEFDDSFHFMLAKSLVELINSNFNHNQFIFSSHQIEHLDQDLRSDQIYLVEKDFEGESNLYSLFDFNESQSKTSRQDVSFTKKYFEGHYGSLPNILLSRISKNKDNNI